ncbi:MAG: CinA family protein [Pirellulaceae bacterium]|nr:CinA family protein [Pirellulaceae bacterium]MDP6555678.1 CinA family protein [Pirellulaceae bacterium]MDP6718706.1 CinA family protein [Pirellulaceae bacterium]
MKLAREARRIAQLLKTSKQRVVFAESCTAGLVSAQLAAVPGISDLYCGSFVTYRNRSKQDWLSVPEELLQDPGPVSEIVASKMAESALKQTREAEIAVSVTGHLGPNAPKRQDGVVFIGVAIQMADASRPGIEVSRHHLKTTTRHERQREAAGLVLSNLSRVLRRGV